PVPRPGYRVGLPWAGQWHLLVNTDDPAWGGSGFSGTVAADGITASDDVAWQGQ
ncbi:MAG TPA: hypothetical protein DCR14_13355, partial [Acidimicrobiaceae bacterium]|nr:hypothetical protein [Acidimicrobiaceae bacterium]